MSNNLSSLNELGRIDVGFGLLPTMAAIKKEFHSKSPFSNLNEFIIQLRQFMALEDAFCGSEFDKSDSQLCNLTKPDFLLFEKATIGKNLPKDFIQRIFVPLSPKYFSKYEPLEKGKRCHKVTKNQNKYDGNKPQLVDYLLDKLNLPNKKFEDPYIMHNKPIHNPENFIKRVHTTNNLSILIEQEKIADYIKKSVDKKFKENISDFFQCQYIFPLVGTLRDFPEQTILYFMSYYKTTKQYELSTINTQLNNFIPSSLHNNENIMSILRQCAQSCKPNSHQCFVTKLLARQNQSKGLCVIYFVTFSKEIKKSKKDNFPIKQLYEYINNKLKDWKVYMSRIDYYIFPI